ncbi:MAG: hypothetical protein HY711_07265 [Candidatus Melainabacteria bacterium]|nr:hypothetical protein [Candidatus Melainabacteria bacterium]
MPGDVQIPQTEARGANANSSPTEALMSQIEAHREHERSQSYLGKTVGAIWRNDNESLQELEMLYAQAQHKSNSKDVAAVAAMQKTITDHIQADKLSLSRQDEIIGYTTGFLKTAGLFMRGKLGLAGTVTMYALDEMRPKDNMGTQLTDMGLGGLKGAGLKGMFAVLGAAKVGVATKGVGLGIGSRVHDLCLTRKTYLSADSSSLSLAAGAKRIILGTFNKEAMFADAAAFMFSHSLVAGANRISHDAIANRPLLSTMLTGSTFGMSNGAWGEIQRQQMTGEKLDIARIAQHSLLQGALDGIAAAPGGLQARRASRVSQTSIESGGKSLVSPDAANQLAERQVASVASLLIEQPATTPADKGKDRNATRGRPPETMLADGSRQIIKPDGSIVTIKPNGDVVLQTDGEKRTIQRSDGKIIVEKPDGQIVERRPKSTIRPEEKPLNVASMNMESVAQRLSNPANTPFTLDGVTYASVEAFYRTLPILDPARRSEVAQLHGKAALAVGREYRSVTHGYYLGETFELGSPRHHEIVEQSIRAKFEQNPEVAAQFISTHPRPIIHNTGRPERQGTNYPSHVFTDTLTKIRQELVDKQTAGSQTRADAASIDQVKSAAPAVENGDQTSMTSSPEVHPRSVSRILRGITHPGARDGFNIKLLERAFKGFDRLATNVLGWGGDSIALELQDGTVLKITNWQLTPEMGLRPFDAPILERGTRQADGQSIQYFIQPKVEPATRAQLLAFYKELDKHGYYFREGSIKQIGYYRSLDKIVLIDPWAVEKLPGK